MLTLFLGVFLFFPAIYAFVPFNSLNDTNKNLVCSVIEPLSVDIDNGGVYSAFNFSESWISKKYFWTSNRVDFEKRYKFYTSKIGRSTDDSDIIQVFILPHSHNDPGWLNTYEQYYYRQTKHILDNAVVKLSQLPEMTFVWSEITYLAKWWEESSDLRKLQFKSLVESGRLEIATGGWVVPDEAVNSLFTLIGELTEGQQWVKNNLNVSAKYSWAIDPFGHSSTMSYLLKESGIDGMIIQRLHYAWKHYFAEWKRTEFRWRQRWDSEGHQEINCQSLPYDLYSIKHACGPEPDVCLKFDFRSIQFEYGENYGKMTPITRYNVHKAALEIAAQYQKTASLTNHNVVLVPLGDDFRYDRALEWEQQYTNYMQLFDYINSHPERFSMRIKFGTLADYFEAVAKTVTPKVSLSGDFFPYGDVYVSGEPAYWTGYYGTRPYWKRFHRMLENELRSAEILFTVANRIVAGLDDVVNRKVMEYKYQDLIKARRDFSLFAHHDGITGTSRVWTMDDYGDKLFSAYQNAVAVQQQSIKIITAGNPDIPLLKDAYQEKFETLAGKLPVLVFRQEDDYVTRVKIFNGLGWRRSELVKLIVKSKSVRVLSSSGNPVMSQINPVLSFDEVTGRVEFVEGIFEIVFVAELEALGVSVFRMEEVEDGLENGAQIATVNCEWCGVDKSPFQKSNISLNTLENDQLGLEFHENGLLNNVYIKSENKSLPAEISFGIYKPTNAKSGAYLLRPVVSSEWKFFQISGYLKPVRVAISGPVMCQLISIHHDRHETIKLNTTLIKSIASSDFPAPEGILLDTYVDFSRDSSNRAEVYMRLQTKLNSSSHDANHLVMFTDQNGVTFEERKTIPEINYEGNTYPVTTAAYLEDNHDENLRVSLLVDRSHGFNSMQPGRLETLIERKSLYDDGRGMAEGVSDSRPTISSYRLVIEQLPVRPSAHKYSLWQPTLSTHRTSLQLNYPPNLFVALEPKLHGSEIESDAFSLLNEPLPDNVHLINFKTLSSPRNTSNETNFRQSFNRNDDKAGNEVLLNLQYLWDYETDFRGRDCNDTMRNGSTPSTPDKYFDLDSKEMKFKFFNVSSVYRTSLTGVNDIITPRKEEGNESSISLAREYAVVVSENSSNEFSLWKISPISSFKLTF